MSEPEFSRYQAKPEILSQVSGVRFWAIIGATAAGKSTIMAGALARNPDKLHYVTSTISRGLRPGEVADVDIHSRTEAEMRRRIAAQEYVTVAPRIFDAIYATAPEDYSHSSISILPVIPQAMHLFKALPFQELGQLYILPPSLAVWRQRLQGDRTTAPDLQKRMREAQVSLQYAATEPGLQFLVNENLGMAVNEFERIILDRQPPALSQEAGRELAKELLKSIG